MKNQRQLLATAVFLSFGTPWAQSQTAFTDVTVSNSLKVQNSPTTGNNLELRKNGMILGKGGDTTASLLPGDFAENGQPGFLWHSGKSAFIAGWIYLGNNVGNFSTAFSGGSASGDYSFTAGGSAEGEYSTAVSGGNAMGAYSFAASGIAYGEGSAALNYGSSSGLGSAAFNVSFANGIFTSAFGIYNNANAYASLALGRFNKGNFTAPTSGQANGGDTIWIAADPVFEIGNGTSPSNSNRSNAMTVYKNGNTELGGKLTISNGGTSTATPVIVLDPANSDIKINNQSVLKANGLFTGTLLSTSTAGNALGGSLNIGTTSAARNGDAVVNIVTTTSTNPTQGLVISNPTANPGYPGYGLVLQTRANSAYIGLTNGAGTLGFGNPAFGNNLTLDFTNVGSINQFPYLVPFQAVQDNFWIPGGKSGAVLAVPGGGSVLAFGANELTDITHQYVGIGRGMQFKSYTNSSTGNRGFNFKFDTATTSAGLGGFAHSQWLTGGSAIMTLTPTGKLGLGTTTPLGGFHFENTSASDSWVYLQGNVGGSSPSASVNRGLIYGWNASGGNGETQLLYGSGLGSAPRLDIGSWNGSAKSIAMTVQSGKVGVGTSSPAEKLDVVGNVKVSGIIRCAAGGDISMGAFTAGTAP